MRGASLARIGAEAAGRGGDEDPTVRYHFSATNDETRHGKMIDKLFPDGVVALEANPSMWEESLEPEEERGLGSVVARRRREYAAGRASARAALARLGVRNCAIPRGPDRAPVWPAGIAGSIAHTADWCGAAVARVERFAGIGLDAETAVPLPEGVESILFTAREVVGLTQLPAAPPGLSWMLVAFSAKECTYKCIYPSTRAFLEFRDVEISLDPATQSFAARLLRGPTPADGVRDVSGRFAFDGRRVYVGAVIHARPAGSPDDATATTASRRAGAEPRSVSASAV